VQYQVFNYSNKILWPQHFIIFKSTSDLEYYLIDKEHGNISNMKV
jgi:hypothetical protein